MGSINPLYSPDFHVIGLIFHRLVCQYVWHVKSLFQSNISIPLLYQGIFYKYNFNNGWNSLRIGQNTCFIILFEGYILGPDVRPGDIGP